VVRGLPVVLLIMLPGRTPARQLPVFRLRADPCFERCVASLCLKAVTGPITVCAQPCDGDRYVVDIPATNRPPRASLTRIKVGPYGARIICEPELAPCRVRATDTECGDGNATTRDVCISPGCAHLCGEVR
jgi:hypothetical protein